jgi:hypothetical protein
MKKRSGWGSVRNWFVAATLAAWVATVAGCASRPGGEIVSSSSVASFGAMDIAQIVPGKTTRNELEARFGKPNRVAADAKGREVHSYDFQRQKWEPGKFEGTQVHSQNGLVMQPTNVPQWESGHRKHEQKRLRVTLNSADIVDAVKVVD